MTGEHGEDGGAPGEDRPLEERLAGEGAPDHATVSRRADVSRRKATGAFYTPPALADFVVGRALERLGDAGDGEPGPGLRVLDPAVGGGVFLDCVARRAGGPAGPDATPRLELVGVDVEARALAASRETLARHDRGAVELVEGDFFGWSAPGAPFDLVVGNPPWGLTGSDANGSSRYRDLALDFVHRGVGLLAPTGSLGVLLPGTWPFSRSGAEFRRFLRGLERDVAVYRLDQGWFEDATFTAEPVALVLGPAVERSSRLSLFDATGTPPAPEEHYEVPLDRTRDYPGGRFPAAPEPLHRLFDGGDAGAPVEIVTPPELGLAVYSGLKTYANREYVFDSGTAGELAAAGEATIRAELTGTERRDGVEADRPVLVPYDKGGRTRTGDGEWTAFWTPVTHYVRWDADAVAYYRSKGGMRNEGTYFADGIHFSASGRNCPVFRLSNGLVYDADYPFVPAAGEDRWPLLALLNSPPCLYLIEHAVNPTAHFKNRDFEAVPLPAFRGVDTGDLEAAGRRICDLRRAGDPVPGERYRELSRASAALYGLSEAEERRAWEWFRADRLGAGGPG